MREIFTHDYDNEVETSKCPERESVLTFLRGQDAYCVTAGYFTDAVTGEVVEGADWGWYQSGDWGWSDRDTYHFERYGLALDPDFVAYALGS